MIKLLLINMIFVGSFFYENLIFLHPQLNIEERLIDFNLTEEDIRYVRYYFLEKDYFDLATLPKVPARKNVNTFFNILRNAENKKWPKAYLYLLDIVPELFEEEFGC